MCQYSLQWRVINDVYKKTDLTRGEGRTICIVQGRKWKTSGDIINMIEENEWFVLVCMQCMQAVLEPERERERKRAREATRAGAHMTDAPWALRRPIGSLGSPELLQRRSERGFSHTHTHPDPIRAAHAPQGSADARWQWYAWDGKSVWKLYGTHRRRRDICGLISLGNVEHFLFLCILPNVFCVVREREWVIWRKSD